MMATCVLNCRSHKKHDPSTMGLIELPAYLDPILMGGIISLEVVLVV